MNETICWSLARRRTILLVVDRDDATRNHLERKLNKYAVHAARDGVHALDILRRIGPPDVVICDADMPRMSALALLRTMKCDPTLRHVPVLLFTAPGRPSQIAEALDAGADDVIPKSLDSVRLLERIAKVVS